MFSKAQYGRMRRLRSDAWLAECERTGIAPNDRSEEDGWYRDMLFTACNVTTSHDLDGKADFDAVMLQLAIVSGIDREIDYWSAAAARRFEYLIGKKLLVIGRLTGESHDWSYVRGILHQMGLPEHLADVPTDCMRNVFIALDTHIRRLKERAFRVLDGGHCQLHDAHHDSQSDLPF